LDNSRNLIGSLVAGISTGFCRRNYTRTPRNSSYNSSRKSIQRQKSTLATKDGHIDVLTGGLLNYNILTLSP
jgi:hypothetical protein